MNELINFINSNNLGDIRENVSFKTLTSYRTGGSARLVFLPNDVQALKGFLSFSKDKNIKFKVFGNGSNILASDDFYDGVIVKLSKFNNSKIEDMKFYAEAGCNLIKVSNELCKSGFSGFEFATGIPGTIGGAIYMNAGAYLKDISSILISTDVLDLKDFSIKTLNLDELDMSYRTTIFQKKKEYIILSGLFKLEVGNKEEITKLVSSRKERRLATQPLEYPSAGSVFRNPVDHYAGELIEKSNLKGAMIGGAEISSKHANFIINKDNATSTDIKMLMDLAHNVVLKEYNIDLHREQELFNWE